MVAIKTFEEFCKIEEDGKPAYDNMYLPFAGNEGNVFRRKPAFVNFRKAHGDIERELTWDITHRKKCRTVDKSLEPFKRRMYEVYKIMRYSGFSDNEVLH